jgi:hypothetical protein
MQSRLIRRSPQQVPPAAGLNPSLNLLNSKGEIDPLEYLFCAIGLAVVMTIASTFLRSALLKAKEAIDPIAIVRSYGIWVLICVVTYFAQGNAMIKRWRAALDMDAVPVSLQILIRLSLISPLLSIWMPTVTLLVPWYRRMKSGPRYEPPKLSDVFLNLFVAFIAFHIGFLVWSYRKGEIELAGALQLQPSGTGEEQATLSALRIGNQHEIQFLANSYRVHVFPYLSPMQKLGALTISDIKRADWIEAEAENPNAQLCSAKVAYLGIVVEDCFFYSYRKIDQVTPFVSALAGLKAEAKYRQSVFNAENEKRAQGTAPTDMGSNLRSLARGFVFFSNLVTLIENRERIASITFRPLGLLKHSGSPEVPLLMFLQDFQRPFFVKKILLPMIPQFDQLVTSFSSLKFQLPRDQEIAGEKQVRDLQARINLLTNDPLLTLF